MRYKLSDFIEFNPTEKLPKGFVATEIDMASITPFQKFVCSAKKSPYRGGMKFRNNDTIMARITPCLENGKTAFISGLEDDEVGFGSTEYIILRAKEEKTTPEFVYYLAISSAFRSKAISLMTGTSGRQRVQTDSLMEYEIDLPDLETQKKVVRTLSALDNKIELNNQQNQTLMDIAIKTYRDLLGKQDDSWISGYIGDEKTTKIVKSGVHDYSGTKKYIATADVSGINITHFENVTFCDKPSRANMTPKKDTIWFAKMEGSSKNLLVADFCQELQDDYILSTGFIGIECLQDTLYYLWCYINDEKFLDIKNSLSTGTLMAGISNSTIKNAKYTVPPKEILNDFNKIAKPIFEKIYRNSMGNESLINLRDVLLPKLMNGEKNLGNVGID